MCYPVSRRYTDGLDASRVLRNGCLSAFEDVCQEGVAEICANGKDLTLHRLPGSKARTAINDSKGYGQRVLQIPRREQPIKQSLLGHTWPQKASTTTPLSLSTAALRINNTHRNARIAHPLREPIHRSLTNAMTTGKHSPMVSSCCVPSLWECSRVVSSRCLTQSAFLSPFSQTITPHYQVPKTRFVPNFTKLSLSSRQRVLPTARTVCYPAGVRVGT